MKVKVTKLNDGVLFEVLNAKGQPVKARKHDQDEALHRAANRWQQEVLAAAEKLGIRNTGYMRSYVDRGYMRLTDDMRKPYGYGIWKLEPVGFAAQDERGGIHMPDTGSTPTEGRAKHLLAYQAPLEHHVDESYMHSWWSIWDV